MNEDASQELEALAAIYLEAFAALPPDGCAVVARPTTDETNQEAKVAARLEFRLMDGYPTAPGSVPRIGVSSELGLSEVRCEDLLVHLNQVAADNAGMPCIFTVVEAAREWLALRNFASDDSAHAKMMARENEKKIALQKEEEREVAEASGRERRKKPVPKFANETPITAESYEKWLTAYKKEQAAKLPPVSDKKLTGREIFEGKAGLSLKDLLLEEDKEARDGQDHGEEEDFDVAVFGQEEDVSSLEDSAGEEEGGGE